MEFWPRIDDTMWIYVLNPESKTMQFDLNPESKTMQFDWIGTLTLVLQSFGVDGDIVTN